MTESINESTIISINEKYSVQADDERKYVVDTSNDFIKEYIYELKEDLATMDFKAFRDKYKTKIKKVLIHLRI